MNERERLKLDSIVGEMETNGESVENIQFVVNDFKEESTQNEIVKQEEQADQVSNAQDENNISFPMSSKAFDSSMDHFEEAPEDPLLKYGFSGVNKYLKETPIEEQSLGMQSLIGLGDAFGHDAAAFEGLIKSISKRDLGEFEKAFSNPDPGIFREEREDLRGYWQDLSKETDSKPLKKIYSLMGFLGEAGYGALESPFGLLTGTVRAGAKQLSKLKPRGVDPKDLISPEGIPFTPAQFKGQESSFIESTAQLNPFTSSIPENIKAKQIGMTEDLLNVAGGKIGAKPVSQMDKGLSGETIEKAFGTAKETVSKKFQEGEGLIQDLTGELPLSGDIKMVSVESKSGLLDEFGKPIKTQKPIFTSKAVKSVDELLEGKGYKIGDEIKNTKSISGETIKKSLKFRKDIRDANTIKELINTKRNIQDEIFQDVKSGLFAGKKDQAFLKSIHKDLNDSIEESMRSSFKVDGISKEGADTVADTYRAINKMYKDNIELLNEPSKILSIGKGKSDNIVQRLKAMGSDNLNKIKTASKTKPEIKALYDEISRGAYEDIIFRSMTKGKVSPDKFMTNWSEISKNRKLRSALFPEDMIQEVDKQVRNFQKMSKGDLAKMNPSGTARALTISNVAKNKMDALQLALWYYPIKHYYKSGKLPQESAINFMSLTGKKISQNKLLKLANESSTYGHFLRAATKADDEN